jgi:branched-subunit amino acid aminotransferase/4-amino-4-deoxychorismate lyase
MVTLLWTLSLPRSNDDNQASEDDSGSSSAIIGVQGHICRAASSSGDDTDEEEDFPFANYAPQPLTVVVAYDRHGSQNLPNRQPHPRAKLSDWCRERRPLEDRFRTNCYEARANNDAACAVAVDEVLLVRQQQQGNDDSVILLEGLTSNLFVVYPNGLLRTADDQNVLPGYARHLVLQQAAQMMSPRKNHNGIRKVDSRTPIQLSEADQWQQVFVSSAIRLVVPVGRILVVANERYNGNGCENGQRRVFLREIWNQNLTGINVSNKTQSLLWRKLYKSIIQQQYHQQQQR